MWEFFQRKICLTTHDEEWRHAQHEFKRVGLDVDKLQSLPDDLGPNQSFSKSVRQILIEFYESDATTLLHLEDDVTFRDYQHLTPALSELPDDWDVVYLGANLICWNNGEPAPERFSEHLFKIGAAWTTHAIGYNKKCVLDLLLHQPGFSEIMFDNWLSTRLSSMNAFVVAPMVAYQRPHQSSIWGRYDDYTPIFAASDERLV